jgi:hypothetical protein
MRIHLGASLYNGATCCGQGVRHSGASLLGVMVVDRSDDGLADALLSEIPVSGMHQVVVENTRGVGHPVQGQVAVSGDQNSEDAGIKERSFMRRGTGRMTFGGARVVLARKRGCWSLSGPVSGSEGQRLAAR